MSMTFMTRMGRIFEADSLAFMPRNIADDSVDLIVTSPPFALLRKKDYGNEAQDNYVQWFKDFGREFYRVLKPTGSLVIDIGGSWIPGQPTRSLYHFELLIMLCKELDFHLAQEFYWWNPSKLPSPAEWVNVRRIRVKDAVNSIYWLSKTPWPKASNKRILFPYSESMKDLLKNGYSPKTRPSGHDISDNFLIDNQAAIPPNLLAIPNTESNSYYLRYCKEHHLPVHPARFPAKLPEFFVRMLTNEGDVVLDPFAGSCVVGEVCEKLQRKWICIEIDRDYVSGAVGRFDKESLANSTNGDDTSYRIFNPSAIWSKLDAKTPISDDGGRKRVNVKSSYRKAKKE